MIRIRHFEAKCVELYQAQKILGFLHLYDGEEAVSVGLWRLCHPRDAVIATYREHGQAIARGIGMDRLMAEMLGKEEGCCRGRGGSMHIFDRATRFYGGNAIVGGGLPLAVGVALADKMQSRDAVTACFFGDGAVDEGEFHESMNLASLWRLPVLFVCENNLYAMGMALKRAEAETDVSRKAAGYRMPGVAVDGMDVVAVEAAARRAAAEIRGWCRARNCWNAALTGSAPIRCSTRSSTATRMKLRCGVRKGRSCASRVGWKLTDCSTPRRVSRIENEVDSRDRCGSGFCAGSYS